jgi:Zn-dependent protease with chaperone function
MTEAQFETRVRTLEDYAKRHPTGYKVRVVLLALSGYGYIAFLVVLALALSVGLLGLLVYFRAVALIKVALLPLIFAGVLLRSLWVKLEEPEGRELSPEEAPQLFEFLERTTTALDAPRIHRVLLDDQFNAAVSQVPRLGLFGWNRNFLIIGMPLLTALSPEQFQAVLAHEIGHVSGNHGGFSSWVYRIRRTWGTLETKVEQDAEIGSFLLRAFLHWFAPALNAYTFVLARAQEYEADRAAADVVGREAAAGALIETAHKASFFEGEYWNRVIEASKRQPDPINNAFSGMAEAYRGWVTSNRIESTLRSALAMPTGYADTHPSLSDRLAALGHPLATVGKEAGNRVEYASAPVAMTAAEWVFGPKLPERLATFDREWEEKVHFRWREAYRKASEMRQGIEELTARPIETLSDEELWKLISGTDEFVGEDAAIPFVREMLVRHPDHVGGNFFLGRHLLKNDDPAGIPHLEAAMKADHEGTFVICDLLHEYYEKKGDQTGIGQVRATLDDYRALLNKAAEERQRFDENEVLEPHQLDAELVRAIRGALMELQDLKAVWIARRRVEVLPDWPYFIIGIEAEPTWNPLGRKAREQTLLGQISGLNFPFSFRCFILNSETRWLAEKYRQLPDAKIYGL